MKYFITLISILLLAAISWIVFFSGIILKKKVQVTSNETSQTAKSLVSNLDKPQIVVLQTNLGTIKIQTDPESAPQTSANFTKLASQGFYNNLTFHRLIPGFVIQGGDPKGDGTGGPGYTLPAEIKLPHKRGAVAMARLPNEVNPQRQSSGSQFYIALQDLPSLDGQYTVFGEVVDGTAVVERMAKVETDNLDRPLTAVVIQKAFVVE